jgi:membrane protease YdiL (CAAX protease family)
MKKAPKTQNAKPAIYSGILDILLIGAVYLLAQLIAALILGIDADSIQTLSPEKVIGSYVASGIIMALGLVGVMKAYGWSAQSISFNRLRVQDVGVALVGFLVYLFLTIIAGVLLRLIPGVDESQKQDLGLDNISSTLLPAAFLALAVVPPFVEEFMFRGFLYHRLKFHRYSKVASALVVSIIFGVLHGQINVAVDTFILSMVMIYVMERQKNLWSAVFVHALKNTLAFLVLFVFA